MTNVNLENLNIELYETLKSSVIALNLDLERFKEKKVKISGARARSMLLDIKKLCDSLRKQLLTQIKELPVKYRPEELSEREVMEELGEIPKVMLKHESMLKHEVEPEYDVEEVKLITERIKRVRKANKIKGIIY